MNIRTTLQIAALSATLCLVSCGGNGKDTASDSAAPETTASDSSAAAREDSIKAEEEKQQAEQLEAEQQQKRDEFRSHLPSGRKFFKKGSWERVKYLRSLGFKGKVREYEGDSEYQASGTLTYTLDDMKCEVSINSSLPMGTYRFTVTGDDEALNSLYSSFKSVRNSGDDIVSTSLQGNTVVVNWQGYAP